MPGSRPVLSEGPTDPSGTGHSRAGDETARSRLAKRYSSTASDIIGTNSALLTEVLSFDYSPSAISYNRADNPRTVCSISG